MEQNTQENIRGTSDGEALQRHEQQPQSEGASRAASVKMLLNYTTPSQSLGDN